MKNSLGLFLGFLCLLSARLAIAGELDIELPDAEEGEVVVSVVAHDAGNMPEPLTENMVLHQKNRMFSPHLMVIPVNSAVDMTNDDVVYHNVFSFSNAKSFDLGLYPHGDHKEVLFDKPGEVKIFCAVHPQMHAVILVMDTPWYKRVKDEKRVTFSDLPEGEYEVRLWRKNKSQLTGPTIRVPQQGRAKVTLTEKPEQVAE